MVLNFKQPEKKQRTVSKDVCSVELNSQMYPANPAKMLCVH